MITSRQDRNRGPGSQNSARVFKMFCQKMAKCCQSRSRKVSLPASSSNWRNRSPVVWDCFPDTKPINLYDEIFLPSKAWVNKFTERYKAEIVLSCYCMFYPGTCNDETAKSLRKPMLTGAWIGVQSGSERVQKRYL